MKIKETYAGFTKQITPGMLGFFIVLDNGGFELDINKIYQQAIHFPRIIILGGEPFEQKEEIYKLAKKVVKGNPDIIIEIHTKGLYKPLGLSILNNIIYYVNVQLKNSGIPFDRRINDTSLIWFNESTGNYIFYIETKDDMDEVDLLINNYVLKKSKIVVMPKRGIKDYISMLKEIIKYCKIKGYGYSFDFDSIMEGVSNGRL